MANQLTIGLWQQRQWQWRTSYRIEPIFLECVPGWMIAMLLKLDSGDSDSRGVHWAILGWGLVIYHWILPLPLRLFRCHTISCCSGHNWRGHRRVRAHPPNWRPVTQFTRFRTWPASWPTNCTSHAVSGGLSRISVTDACPTCINAFYRAGWLVSGLASPGLPNTIQL